MNFQFKNIKSMIKNKNKNSNDPSPNVSFQIIHPKNL
jgi:hypothetical protein